MVINLRSKSVCFRIKLLKLIDSIWLFHVINIVPILSVLISVQDLINCVPGRSWILLLFCQQGICTHRRPSVWRVHKVHNRCELFLVKYTNLDYTMSLGDKVKERQFLEILQVHWIIKRQIWVTLEMRIHCQPLACCSLKLQQRQYLWMERQRITWN